jgi:hypothetical protein
MVKPGNQIITKTLLRHHPSSFLHQPHVMWVCWGCRLTHRLILTKCPFRPQHNPTLKHQQPKHHVFSLSFCSSRANPQIPPLPTRHAFSFYTHVTGINPNDDIVSASATSRATETDYSPVTLSLSLSHSAFSLTLSHIPLYFRREGCQGPGKLRRLCQSKASQTRTWKL